MTCFRPSRSGLKETAPGALRALLVAAAFVIAVGPGDDAMAGPLVTTGPVPEGAVVLDVRAEDDCLHGSLPAARCLPASALLGSDGQAPSSFHAVRWVLGAIGLNGAETVAVLGDESHDAFAAAGVLLLAGQARVHVIVQPGADTAHPGAPRSMSREAVYTAPLREDLMAVSETAPPLRAQLADLARSGQAVSFVPFR